MQMFFIYLWNQYLKPMSSWDSPCIFYCNISSSSLGFIFAWYSELPGYRIYYVDVIVVVYLKFIFKLKVNLFDPLYVYFETQMHTFQHLFFIFVFLHWLHFLVLSPVHLVLHRISTDFLQCAKESSLPRQFYILFLSLAQAVHFHTLSIFS